MSYVYFIRKGGENIFKIGKGNDPQKRLDVLQTGNESRLFLCALIECQASYIIESEIHSAFSTYRLEGEWFCLSWDDVLSVLRVYSKYYTVTVFDKQLQQSNEYLRRGVIDAGTQQALLLKIRELDLEVVKLNAQIRMELSYEQEAIKSRTRIEDLHKWIIDLQHERLNLLHALENNLPIESVERIKIRTVMT